jgi:hypothetical protein
MKMFVSMSAKSVVSDFQRRLSVHEREAERLRAMIYVLDKFSEHLDSDVVSEQVGDTVLLITHGTVRAAERLRLWFSHEFKVKFDKSTELGVYRAKDVSFVKTESGHLFADLTISLHKPEIAVSLDNIRIA